MEVPFPEEYGKKLKGEMEQHNSKQTTKCFQRLDYLSLL